MANIVYLLRLLARSRRIGSNISTVQQSTSGLSTDSRSNPRLLGIERKLRLMHRSEFDDMKLCGVSFVSFRT